MNNIRVDFTIKDIENITGIKAHTIRIWEKRYNLLVPQRTETNFRYYSQESLLKLLNVVLLYNNNIKISKIAKFTEDEIKLHAREITCSMAVNEDAINSFKMSMFQFDKALFNNTYNKLLHKKTFRGIFKDIFIPFLHHIGLLWQTDTLMPAHEHFISNLIAQKIQINIEMLQYNLTDTKKTYVLFLPMNEIHDIGLMYLDYELALRGNRSIYLGQSLPLDNLNYFFQKDQEICFISSMTVRPYDEKIKPYFKEVDNILKNTNHSFIAVGNKAKQIDPTIYESNIKIYGGIEDLLKGL